MDKAPRVELQFDNFKRAFARLKEAFAEDETEIARDAIILRFEFTFEMAWKTMFRYLADKGDDVLPKAWLVLPAAFEVKLIDDADTWEQLRKFRNDLSHEYNEGKAIEIAAFVRTKGRDAFETFAATMAQRL